MLMCGFFMYKNPPKEINGIIGYRTSMSKKNIDTWKFAHSSENSIGYMTLIVEGIQLVVILGSIVFVERALKKTFDENGVRR